MTVTGLTVAMHMSDGLVNAPTAAAFAFVAAIGLAVAATRARADLDERTAPMAGLVTAFVFAVQMINFPILPGASGHLLGGALVAILVGPWVGTLCIAIVLVVQCLLFADGGITALGTNITNMALVGTFTDWGAYTAQSGRAKICYALSEPKARSPGSLKDTKGYLFVSFRPADNVRNEVASVLNFDTKDGSPGALAIGQANFELVTKGKNAWVKNPSDEADAIAAMSKGGTLTLQATSARGNKTSDRYSLAGFAQAIDRARRDCP